MSVHKILLIIVSVIVVVYINYGSPMVYSISYDIQAKYIDEVFIHYENNVYYVYEDIYFQSKNIVLDLNVEVSSEVREKILSYISLAPTNDEYSDIISFIRGNVSSKLDNLGIPYEYIRPSLIYVDESTGIAELGYVLNVFYDSNYAGEILQNLEPLKPILNSMFKIWRDRVSQAVSALYGVDIDTSFRDQFIRIVILDTKASPQYIVGEGVTIVYPTKLIDNPFQSSYVSEVLRKQISQKYDNIVGYDFGYGILKIFLGRKTMGNPAGYTLEQLINQASDIRNEVFGRDDLPIQVVVIEEYNPLDTDIEPSDEPTVEESSSEQPAEKELINMNKPSNDVNKDEEDIKDVEVTDNNYQIIILIIIITFLSSIFLIYLTGGRG